MSETIQVPKQTDESLIQTLESIREEMLDLCQLQIRVTPHSGASQLTFATASEQDLASVKYVLDEHSTIMPSLALFDANHGQNALNITRRPAEVTDTAVVEWNNWAARLGEPNSHRAFVRLSALARKALRALNTEAGLFGDGASASNRYEAAQQAVLNSLAETQKSMLVDFHAKALELETSARQKYDRLETELREELKTEAEALRLQHEARTREAEEKEAALLRKEESFNTKEARYVARQQQQQQFDQIKGWLEDWSLTPGTRRKRLSVLVTYVAGILITLALTGWFSEQNIELLKAKNISEITWWQWLVISLRSIAPFAAFTTFIIYFIRWSSAWARQHSEEEFRNRSRILDIGRSAWLLEAVRDAQDNKRELPTELLKELSRNLFSYSASVESDDLHPHAITELITHGLTGLRVKSPDGSEFEATRGKKA